ncbi:MAG: 5-(carboxyamino)imidazole ribonucleotide synthase [Rhodospirillaceae bacterium]
MPTSLAISPLPPGSTLGMLGGGQLGRMTALAAARLGYRVHVFTPEPDSPCAEVSAAATVADFSDEAALAAFADAVDVVTLEWENVPPESVSALARRVVVRPGAAVLAVTRDRIREKTFVNCLGISTAPWRPVHSAADVADALREVGRPAVLKVARLGYDGKGQLLLGPDADPETSWNGLAAGHALDAVVEGFVEFACEISVIVARGADGAMRSYPAVENQHRHHILARTIVPARIAPAVAAEADGIARRITEALGVVGLLAVEMFVGRDGSVLVNELAPRPHNSGHWTMDACATSQFEQLVRAVCGLPLGDTAATGPAMMDNLIGDEVERWRELVAAPAARLHLYGKREVRPGRKMGHVTWIGGAATTGEDADD